MQVLLTAVAQVAAAVAFMSRTMPRFSSRALGNSQIAGNSARDQQILSNSIHFTPIRAIFLGKTAPSQYSGGIVRMLFSYRFFLSFSCFVIP